MNNYVSIRKFITQVTEKMKSADDIITSIGTISGDSAIQYVVHCKEVDGNSYDIEIEKAFDDWSKVF